MRLIDRRKCQEDTVINLAIVRGVLGLAFLLSFGYLTMAALGRTSPDWVGNIVLSITSGLVGYLSRTPQRSAGIHTGDVQNVNVDQAEPEPDAKQDQLQESTATNEEQQKP